MTKLTENPKVDFYFEKNEQWSRELEQLRKIALNCGLTEELKWGSPCYTYDQRNIVLIHVFKEYCALLFFKGALLSDPDGILVQQTKNVQAARQIRFSDVKQIVQLKNSIRAYIFETIEIEKSGLKPELKKTNDFEVIEEFRDRLNKNAALKKAFQALPPGRQRGYLLYFADAKQSKTRALRIEKYMQHILTGKGLND